MKILSIKTTIILLLLNSLTECLGQTNYASFIKPEKVGEKQEIKSGDGSSEEIVYLGTTHDINGQLIYHVFSVFRLVQSAVVKHGHSEVVFLNKSREFVKSYNLVSPEELPFLLRNNFLNFYYSEDNEKTFKVLEVEVIQQLPELLCVSPNTCY